MLKSSIGRLQAWQSNIELEASSRVNAYCIMKVFQDLRDQFTDDFAVNIRQAAINSVGPKRQLGVINS